MGSSPNSSATETSPNFNILLFLIMVLASNLLLLSHVDARQLGRMPEPLGRLGDQTNNENKEKVVEPMTKARENHRHLGTDEVKNLPTNLNIPFVPPLPQIPFVPPLPQIPFVPPLPQIPFVPPLPQIPFVPPLPQIPQIPFAPPLPGIPLPPIPFPPPIPQIPGFPPLPTIPTLPTLPPFNVPNIPFLNIPPPA